MSNEVKHTPGTWVESSEFEDWSIDTGGNNTFCLVGPEGEAPVAIVVVPSAFDMDDELDANARLIAAAPELLEAAQAWIAEEEGKGRSGTISMYAAIAKATGK